MPRARKLGFYLVCISVCEIGIHYIGPFHFWMPRIGWTYLLDDTFRLGDCLAFFLTEIPSACWTFLLGALFIYGKRPLKTYLASEVLLAAPTLRLFLRVIVIEPGHILERGHVLVTLTGYFMLFVMAVFDFIPSWMAIQALREASTKKRLVAEP